MKVNQLSTALFFAGGTEHDVLLRLYCHQIIQDWAFWYSKLQQLRNKKFLKPYSPSKVPKAKEIIKFPRAAYEQIVEHIVEYNKKHRTTAHPSQLQLSRATLERFTGKSKNNPQQHYNSSMDMLAFFVGAKDYQDFLKQYHAFLQLKASFSNIFLKVQSWKGTQQLEPPKPPLLLPKKVSKTPDSEQNPEIKALIKRAERLPQKTTQKRQESLFFALEKVLYAEETHYNNLYQPPRFSKKQKYIYSSLLLSMLLLGFGLWLFLQPPEITAQDLQNIQIKVTEIDQAPAGHATVYYAIDASHFKGLVPLDSFEISIGVTDRKLSKWKDTISFMHENVRTATDGAKILFKNGTQPLTYRKKHLLYLKSPDWYTYASGRTNPNQDQADWYSKMIPKEMAEQKGFMSFPDFLIPTTFKRYYMTEFILFQEIPVSISNFKAEARLKLIQNDSLNATCYHSGFGLYSFDLDKKISPHIYNHVYLEGCGHWGNIYGNFRLLAEDDYKNIHREKGFTVSLEELQEWHTLKIEVKNSTIRYFFSDKLIRSVPLEGLQGIINQIAISVKGNAAVDYVRFWNGKGQLVYAEEFGGEVVE